MPEEANAGDLKRDHDKAAMPTANGSTAKKPKLAAWPKLGETPAIPKEEKLKKDIETRVLEAKRQQAAKRDAVLVIQKPLLVHGRGATTMSPEVEARVLEAKRSQAFKREAVLRSETSLLKHTRPSNMTPEVEQRVLEAKRLQAQKKHQQQVDYGVPQAPSVPSSPMSGEASKSIKEKQVAWQEQNKDKLQERIRENLRLQAEKKAQRTTEREARERNMALLDSPQDTKGKNSKKPALTPDEQKKRDLELEIAMRVAEAKRVQAAKKEAKSAAEQRTLEQKALAHGSPHGKK